MRTPPRLLVLLAAAALVAAPTSAAGAAQPATTTPATTTTPAPTCGGEIVYKTDGQPWQCTFDDEFNGTSLDSSMWSPQLTATSGYHSGNECFVNNPDNISVSGGTLNLTVEQAPAPFVCKSPKGNYTTDYTSGMVTTQGSFSQTYGRFEIRAAFPAATVKGLQESLWLWPVDSTKYGLSWPASGELDIAEAYSKYPTLAIPFIHYILGGLDTHITSNTCVIGSPGTFHTYVLQWSPGSISFIYDGKTCLTDTAWKPYQLTPPAPFDQPFFIALTQTLGTGTNAFVAGTTPLPATTQVDYVRVWQ